MKRTFYHEIQCFGIGCLPQTVLVRDADRTLTPAEASAKVKSARVCAGASVFRYMGTEEHPPSWKPRKWQTVLSEVQS